MSSRGPNELYALPLDRFVPERNALAKELRQAGRRDEAGEVAALRKPSVAAWAVNRLARAHGRELAALLAAGDDLIDVQSRLVAGDADGQELARAAERERAGVSDLVRAARELLAAEGQSASPTVLERVSETLHAAALDESARPAVQEGRLERELRHVGFWTGGEGAAPASRSARPAKRAAPREPTKAEAEAEAEASAPASARRRARTPAPPSPRHGARRRGPTRPPPVRQRRRTRAAEALEAAAQEDEEAEEALATARREAEEAAEALQAAERELEALSDD